MRALRSSQQALSGEHVSVFSLGLVDSGAGLRVRQVSAETEPFETVENLLCVG